MHYIISDIHGKAIAGYLKEEPLQTFCFKALGNNKTADEIIGEMKDSTIARLIPDYGVETI